MPLNRSSHPASAASAWSLLVSGDRAGTGCFAAARLFDPDPGGTVAYAARWVARWIAYPTPPAAATRRVAASPTPASLIRVRSRVEAFCCLGAVGERGASPGAPDGAT